MANLQNLIITESDYRDTGCAEGGPSCLECPLARCVHDAGGARKAGLADRDMRLRARSYEGATIEELMREFRVGRRAVRRIAFGSRDGDRTRSRGRSRERTDGRSGPGHEARPRRWRGSVRLVG